jgi:hypothetical protein
MEPHFHGSSSCVEAARRSSGGFTPGAGVDFTVWQGSSRSRSWSPAKQALKGFMCKVVCVIPVLYNYMIQIPVNAKEG